MLLNITHHPQKKWPENQRQSANNKYGQVIDYLFPNINPLDSIAQIRNQATAIFQSILEQQALAKEEITVHLMGEMTLVYSLLRLLREEGISCVASTSERIVTDHEDGTKTVTFQFKQFRSYW